MSKIRVLLADDHESTLEWVRKTLNNEFDVVGAVGNGQDAVTEVRRLEPDVLVVDISMPVLSGLDAVAQLGADIRTKVVFLTQHTELELIAAAFVAGASAYVLKSEMSTDLVPAIHEVLKGRKYLSPSARENE
jgi:DNA-binding NarL/FixJ family response regulator